jgi:hypothetical protein
LGARSDISAGIYWAAPGKGMVQPVRQSAAQAYRAGATRQQLNKTLRSLLAMYKRSGTLWPAVE